MRLPFKGLYILTQSFGGNPEFYSQYLVLHPDGIKRPMLGHNGLDFGTPHRTEIVAPHAGEVLEAYNDPQGYGLYVKLENEVEGSVIAHLDVIDVQIGFHLNEGDHVGWSDSTGNSTGPHCHWGYYRKPRDRANGYSGFIDQSPYLAEAGIQLIVGQLPVVKNVLTSEIDYKGLDPNNSESMQVAVNTWHDVAHGKYKSVEEFNGLTIQLDMVKKQLEETQKADQNVSNDLKNYNELKALGYNTLNDINRVLKEKDDTHVALQRENTEIKQRNIALAEQVQKMEEEDSKTAELGFKALDENKKLQETVDEIAKLVEVDKNTKEKIISKIFDLKDLAQRFIQEMEATRMIKKPVKKVEKKVVVIEKKKRDYGWLLNIFQLNSHEEEVNKLEK